MVCERRRRRDIWYSEIRVPGSSRMNRTSPSQFKAIGFWANHTFQKIPENRAAYFGKSNVIKFYRVILNVM
jgi:hypothetical protein